MKKLLLKLLQWGVALAIFVWLIREAVRNDSFTQLRDSPKQWDLLALATVVCFTAVFLTIVRWYFLVRALEVPLTPRDGVRLGFLGYLFNFITPGSVGGDLFKVVFLARKRKGRRTEVALSVLVDRLMGLYGVFVVGTIAIFFTGMWKSDLPHVRLACHVMFWCAGVSTVVLAMGWLPGFSEGPLAKRLERVPRLGYYIERFNRANRMYYSHPWALPLAVAMSIAVQSIFAVGIWLIARGLFPVTPTLGEHMVIVPMGMATGALPLAPNGMGMFELLVNYLYQHMPDVPMTDKSAGLVVSLGYRVITVFIALVGAAIYWASHREMVEVLHEAEEEAKHPHEEEPPPSAPTSHQPATT